MFKTLCFVRMSKKKKIIEIDKIEKILLKNLEKSQLTQNKNI